MIFKKQNKTLALIIGLLVLLLSACVPLEATTGSMDEAAETVTVTHPQGETTVIKNPQTVVVFNYSALDTLDALGIPVTGVIQGPIMPPHLEQYNGEEYASVGGMREPDYEAINALSPDLIVVGLRTAGLYEEMSKIAPTLDITVDWANKWETFSDYMINIGIIFDKEAEVAERLSALETRIIEIKAQAESSDLQGLVVLTSGGEVSGYGPGSRFGMIHDMLGVAPTKDSMAAETHGDAISFEFILEQNPGVLYVLDRDAAIGQEGDQSAEQMMDNELVAETTAGANENIVYLDPVAWYLADHGLSTFEIMVNEVAEGIE
ncbi:MAG: siderophore ABC transporter substrate-binding protein [Chloroflexota bacterium]